MESQGGPHGQLRGPLASRRTPHTDTVAVVMTIPSLWLLANH